MGNLLRKPNDPWWDDKQTPTASIETRDDILRQALVEARDELTSGSARTRPTGRGATCTS